MQVAPAWLLQRSPNILLLIPGTSSRTHLAENIAAAQLALPGDALRILDNIATRARPLTRGEKWGERQLSLIFAWKNLNTAGTIGSYKWGVIDDRFLIIPVNQTTVFILPTGLQHGGRCRFCHDKI